jgi:hypothetical protein
MPVGNILKLNFYAVGVEDEQFRRIAAPRYLSTGAAVIGKSTHNAFCIEILNRDAVREEARLRAACDRRQSKKLRTCADPKYDAFAMPNRSAKQPLVEGRGAVQVRNSYHYVVQAPGHDHRPCWLSHRAWRHHHCGGKQKKCIPARQGAGTASSSQVIHFQLPWVTRRQRLRLNSRHFWSRVPGVLTGRPFHFYDRDKNFWSRCIRFNFDNALLELSFYRDGCDWTSGKIAMRSPRTEPSQSSLAT